MAKVKAKATRPRADRRAVQTGMIRARIDPALKIQAETILDSLGLNASDAIRMFYKQIALTQGLPFPVKIPNAETRQAMEEADAGILNRYGSADEMFRKLGI